MELPSVEEQREACVAYFGELDFLDDHLLRTRWDWERAVERWHLKVGVEVGRFRAIRWLCGLLQEMGRKGILGHCRPAVVALAARRISDEVRSKRYHGQEVW